MSSHSNIESERRVKEDILDEATNHNVPEKDISGGGRVRGGREQVGSIGNGTQRSIVLDEVGGEEEIEVKVGLDHGGVYRFQGQQCAALLDQRNAIVRIYCHGKR